MWYRVTKEYHPPDADYWEEIMPQFDLDDAIAEGDLLVEEVMCNMIEPGLINDGDQDHEEFHPVALSDSDGAFLLKGNVQDNDDIQQIYDEHEIHLVIKIPLADRDTPVSLIRAYDIPVPLSRNATDNTNREIFTQYDLQTKYMAISGGYIKDLTKTEYDDCAYAAGHFCTTLTHMVTIDHVESCLFALYEENNINI